MGPAEESSQHDNATRARQRRYNLICALVHLTFLLAILIPVAIWWLVKDARLWAAAVPEESNTTALPVLDPSMSAASLVERWHIPGRDCTTHPGLCMWCKTGDPSFLPEGKDGSEYYGQFLCPLFGINNRPTHDTATHVTRDVVAKPEACDPLAPFCTSKRDAGVGTQNQGHDVEHSGEHADNRIEEHADKHSHHRSNENTNRLEVTMIPDPKANCSAMMWDSILSDCPLIPAPTPEKTFWEEYAKSE